MFEDNEIPLKPSVMAFITMNPGYPGRAELPESVKVGGVVWVVERLGGWAVRCSGGAAERLERGLVDPTDVLLAYCCPLAFTLEWEKAGLVAARPLIHLRFRRLQLYLCRPQIVAGPVPPRVHGGP
mgnify:CR=1 FL=1